MIPSPEARISELQHRYIAILESRIADLEQGKSLLNEKTTTPNDLKSPIATSQTNEKSVLSPKSDSNEEQNGIKPDNVEITDGTQTKEDEANDEKSRYEVVICHWDIEGGFTTKDESKKEEKKEKDKDGRKAFTFRKMVMKNHFRDGPLAATQTSDVEIEFPALRKLLGKITSKWGWSETVYTCHSPYSALISSWDEAMHEATRADDDDTEEDRQARADLKELLHIIGTSSGHMKLDQYMKSRDTFISEQSINHTALWTLFPPGTLIVARPIDELQIFSVQSCDGFVPEEDAFELICFAFDWNGVEFNRVAFELSIPYWGADRRSISELPFYPLKYYKPEDSSRDITSEEAIEELKTRLIKRGERYREICISKKGNQMFNYNGVAHLQSGRKIMPRTLGSDGDYSRRSDSHSSTLGLNTKHPEAQAQSYVSKRQFMKMVGSAMIDFASFFEYFSPDEPILGGYRAYIGELEILSPERRLNPTIREVYKIDWDKHPRNKKFTKEQYLLCPPRVLGYALKQKQWAQFLVDHLKPPNAADATTFENKLQLEDEHKELIKYSVQAHQQGREYGVRGRSKVLDDFTPDKGKGLVILLYGHPGVGKTLTAESVALLAGKPLLSIGVSDIGLEGDKVEDNLEKVFDLAGKWEAVLLFDEADVFLESRMEGENNLKRNAMVSVLLRVLEFYEGILILTTNRMRSFDIAVQSRIHIAIKYEELFQRQKLNIFTSFLDQLEAWVKKDGGKLPFNGRQIRNVVSTALGVALKDGSNGRVKREHLVTIAEHTKTFKQDLSSQEAIYKSQNR
ncbi:aaa family ATPase [Dendryphion nanum]|uniref:Aaa family ATPase n=1 Tax=Dendryphion nanum TaxID=256645 RepID=A0A9P9DCF6_9PLEO|nr:aaa family ATPase [Dendryphion nanum]